jgi:MutS domain V
VGEDLRVKLNPETLEGWSESARILPAGPMRAMAALLAVCFLAALIVDFAAHTHIPVLLILAIEAVFLRWLRPRAQTVIGGLATNEEGLLLFAEILKRIEREQFTSPRLQRFSAELKHGAEPASRAIRKLALIVSYIDGRESPLALLAELPLLYSVQVALAAEAWRARWGQRMRGWIEIVAEMEALLSLAAYSYEHPADPFPEIVEPENSQAFFDGLELGHPLIPSARCVRNSARLDAQLRVMLVSGSNMSGKSTFLRTAGINTVLAMAGAPIRGKSLRLTPLAIGSRIRSTDSLQENRSSFYTEILQIRQVFKLMKQGAPLLFLFDELLEGTNSNDRRAGAEGLIRALLNHGAIGVVTTHDLALTDLPHVLGDQVRNKHFQDYVENGKMRFDYKLRDGVVAKSNAIELMRLIGLDL